MSGLYFPHEAVAVLQKDLERSEESIKLWKESDKKKYSVAFALQNQLIKEIKEGIEILKGALDK